MIPINETYINELIQESSIDKSLISDGFNTFKDLYDHTTAMYIELCKMRDFLFKYKGIKSDVWKSLKFQLDPKCIGSHRGYFMLGVSDQNIFQIRKLIPLTLWDKCDFAETLEVSPLLFDDSNVNVTRKISHWVDDFKFFDIEEMNKAVDVESSKEILEKLKNETN